MNKFIKLLVVLMTGFSVNSKNINYQFNNQLESNMLRGSGMTSFKKQPSHELLQLNFDNTISTESHKYLTHTCYFEYTYYVNVSTRAQKTINAKSNHPLSLCVEILGQSHTRFYKDGISRGENEIEIDVPYTTPINIYFKGDPSYTKSNIEIEVSFAKQAMITSGVFSEKELNDLKNNSFLQDRIPYFPKSVTVSDVLENKAFEQDVVLYYHSGTQLVGNNELFLENESMFFPNEIDFSNTKLAIWGAVGTAGNGPSIAQYAALQGAQISIGFTSHVIFPVIKNFIYFLVMNYHNYFYRSKPFNEIVQAALRSMKQADAQMLISGDVIRIYGDASAPINSSFPLPQSDNPFRIPNKDSLILVPQNYAEDYFDLSGLKTPIDTTQPSTINDNFGSVNATANKNYRFAFIAPSTGFYTIKAYGRDKIYLCVDDFDKQLFDGGDETKNNNAQVTFLAQENKFYLFHVKRDGSLVSDTEDYIYLEIKKDKAYSLFNYLDVDFHAYGKDKIQYFKTFSSQMQNYYDYNVHNLLSKDSFLNKLNSKIVFIDGPLNNDCDLIVSKKTITTDELPILDNNRLMIWNLSKTLLNISMILKYISYHYASKSYEKGSKCSIGLFYPTESTDEMNDTRIVRFSENLFKNILANKDLSVYECINLTKDEMNLSDNYISKYIYIFGDPNIKTFSDTESNNEFTIDNLIFTSKVAHKN